MRSHPFDPVSLLFGGLFTVAGLIVLAGGDLHDQGVWLVPVGLIGLGVALFTPASLGPQDRSRTTSGSPGTADLSPPSPPSSTAPAEPPE